MSQIVVDLAIGWSVNRVQTGARRAQGAGRSLASGMMASNQPVDLRQLTYLGPNPWITRDPNWPPCLLLDGGGQLSACGNYFEHRDPPIPPGSRRQSVAPDREYARSDRVVPSCPDEWLAPDGAPDPEIIKRHMYPWKYLQGQEEGEAAGAAAGPAAGAGAGVGGQGEAAGAPGPSQQEAPAEVARAGQQEAPPAAVVAPQVVRYVPPVHPPVLPVRPPAGVVPHPVLHPFRPPPAAMPLPAGPFAAGGYQYAPVPPQYHTRPFAPLIAAPMPMVRSAYGAAPPVRGQLIMQHSPAGYPHRP
ncbi:unnamed protein product [Vitrella brassicaformis CCMP3155]|uniref:Uncharacterized protein n=1 Tax=Vitrella brassicaformis (strain CCMP3155) TaxID=1169540 RepID=A0A0G4GKI0_VITBC|nr:unnamed protein product [Vitrella brassicaformis CCMP3155]|eukprot:CEM30516.1 unnamed protein product [Vitrella brassicaformis CCMP3155]